MLPDQIAILASGTAALAAFIAGIAADTWAFAIVLSVVAFALFSGVAFALGLSPFFPGFGHILGAVLLGLFGHAVRKGAQRAKRG